MFKSTTLPKKPNSYMCNFCTKVFTTQLLLNAHVQTHVRQNCVKQAKSPHRLSFKARRSLLVPPQRVSKRISLRKSLDKSSASSRLLSSSNQEKKRLSVKPTASLACNNCTKRFVTHRALFSHKVVKHGLATLDKKVGAVGASKKTIDKEVGKHGGVPASEKMRTIYSNLRTMFEK